MNDIYVTIAVEDVLSESVLKKILAQTGRNYHISLCISKGGNTYLKEKAQAFNQSARGSPFILLTDQDVADECPPEKLRLWLNGNPAHPNFLFRVAVMEIEAWILGDRAAFAQYFKVPIARLPANMDELEKPKEFLVNVARSSTSNNIRDDLVPKARTTATVGPNYNGRLRGFVETTWDAFNAGRHSESLRRTFDRFLQFRPVAAEA